MIVSQKEKSSCRHRKLCVGTTQEWLP